MDLTRYVDELQRQLATAAAAGGDDARDLAGRLTAPLDAAARLALLGALSDAAGEISVELAPGSVDVRLRGGSPEFVVTTPPAPPAAPDEPTPRDDAPTATVDTDGATTRTTLRLPDHLKTQVETAAAHAGVSVNTWLVRAVAGALERSAGQPVGQPGRRPRDDRGSGRLTGWVR